MGSNDGFARSTTNAHRTQWKMYVWKRAKEEINAQRPTYSKFWLIVLEFEAEPNRYRLTVGRTHRCRPKDNGNRKEPKKNTHYQVHRDCRRVQLQSRSRVGKIWKIRKFGLWGTNRQQISFGNSDLWYSKWFTGTITGSKLLRPLSPPNEH